MRLEDLDFAFPDELIAQHPVEPRDSCRLMHLASDGSFAHRRFSDLVDLLHPGDTLVFNDSRVLPARLHAHKSTGGRVELLFLHPSPDAPVSLQGQDARHRGGPAEVDLWEALARPSHRLRPGSVLTLAPGLAVTLREALGEGRWLIEGPVGVPLVAAMERYGTLPLPPYIHEYPDDPESYQTVYAAKLGSAAAPTAGLHFTPELLAALASRGVGAAYVTLHVGLDTFQPIREDVIEDHRIHRETYAIAATELVKLRAARARNGRLVAVGTTATRVLETVAGLGVLDDAGTTPEFSGSPCGVAGETEIFITPGYRFQVVDALLTNFHLPRSSVLALTMAIAGAERLRAAYREAIAMRYRFFSFGDAMLVDTLPTRDAASEDDG